MAERLVVRGAREHNLDDISVDLPRDRMIVLTGFQLSMSLSRDGADAALVHVLNIRESERDAV